MFLNAQVENYITASKNYKSEKKLENLCIIANKTSQKKKQEKGNRKSITEGKKAIKKAGLNLNQSLENKTKKEEDSQAQPQTARQINLDLEVREKNTLKKPNSY